MIQTKIIEVELAKAKLWQAMSTAGFGAHRVGAFGDIDRKRFHLWLGPLLIYDWASSAPLSVTRTMRLPFAGR